MNVVPFPLNVMPQPKVTFEEFDEALRLSNNALPTAFCVGLLYGTICAPHMVPPSVYLPHILGIKMELPAPEITNRILAILHSLHNQLAAMIEDNLPLTARRRSFGSDKEGLLLHASDLWREVFGFRKGLSLGTFEDSDFPTTALRPYADLANEADTIRRIIRRIDSKRKPYTASESGERLKEILQHSKTAVRLMRTIARALYLQRVNKYKAQGVVRIGRNDLCSCGSGKKFKQCCLDKIKPSNAENN